MKKTLSMALCATAALIAVSCKSGESEKVAKTAVSTIEVKDTSCLIELKFPATIRGIQDVNIYPQVEGRITKVYVVEGQHVKKNDVLFKIDDVPYKAAYDAAEAGVEVAKSEMETARLTMESKKNLFKQNIISEFQYKLAANEYRTAQAKLTEARAKLTKTKNDLSFTEVRTMGEGYVGSLPYKIGSLVGTNITTPLTTVSDNSEVYVDFSIPERSYLMVCQLGGHKRDDWIKYLPPLALNTNLGHRYEHSGKVHSASGMYSGSTGALPIRSIFPNPDKMLLSGGSCTAIMGMMEEHCILVPRTSIKEIQDKLFVFVVKDSVLQQTEVMASRYNPQLWMIEPNENGEMPIKPGDKITTTINRLRDGLPVEIVK